MVYLYMLFRLDDPMPLHIAEHPGGIVSRLGGKVNSLPRFFQHDSSDRIVPKLLWRR